MSFALMKSLDCSCWIMGLMSINALIILYMFHLNNQSKFNATLFGRGKLFVGRYSSYVVSNPFVSTIDSGPFLLAGKAYFPSHLKKPFSIQWLYFQSNLWAQPHLLKQYVYLPLYEIGTQILDIPNCPILIFRWGSFHSQY